MDSDVRATRKINPRVKANPISKLLFFYMLGIFRKNYKNGVHENDLYANLDDHKSHTLGDKMEGVWIQHRKHKKWALHRSFFTMFGCQFITIGILQFITELSSIVTVPLGVGGLVSYFDNTSGLTESDAYMYAGIIILSIVFELLLGSQIGLAMDHMAMKMRLSCSSLVYRKALRLSRTALGQTTVGQITTLLSNDVGKFDESFNLCHYVWIAPAQTAIGTYLLYRIIGVSAFSGIGFLILFIPMQIYFGSKIATLRLRTALRTDERVRLMNEILNGIQVIKMYTWEKPFAKLISLARRYEVQAIRSSFFLEAVTFTLDMVLTKIAFLITIIVYLMLGHDISADTIYSVIAIYEVLRPSVTMLFSYGISSVSEVHVSMCRVQKFLNYEELSQTQVISPDLLQHITGNGNINNHSMYQTPKVSLKQVSTKWQASSSEYTLTDINIDINKAQLIAVIGQVGSGKSSLFNVILRELPLSKGSMEIHGNISYASQETWLFSANVRQNILFGEQFVEDRYRTVLKVCALEADLAVLPYGDRTIVGEKGKVLSGGQKARINLARCIYRPADIYLLDDPLSAVDTKVGKLLYEQCITNFLSDKICILITHQLQYLKSADKIIILEDGKIAGHGTYNQLQVSGLDFAKLLKEFNSETEQEDSNRKTIGSRQNSKIDDEEEDNADPEIEEETVKSGSISRSVYTGYLRSGGNYFVIVLLAVMFIATHGTNSGADYYISEWVNLEQQSTESNISDKDEIDRRSMVYEYSGIIIALTILAACQTTFFFLFTMRASVNLHDSIFAKISHATMRFFNLNPTGRILNRFSKDLGVIDEYIPYILFDSQQIFLTFCSIAILTTVVNPWLLLPAVGVVLIFYLLRNVYLETSRSVKRIEGITRSPILSHMTASMQGLSTIRAFSAQDTLINEFDNHQDLHSSAWFLYVSSNRAFSFYLEFICVIIVSAVTISLILLQREYYGGEAGLILTQYLTITGVLEWGMQQWSALENNMTSVERTLEYKKVQTEPIRKPVSTLPRNWPEYGNIVFQNVSMKYNSDEDFVLKDLNFTIHSREKVGVVGRTGAGKSSMILALFQLYDTEGSIIIDNIDTKTLPLINLRSKISIIPQDPVLFSGTVRKNLDPFDEYNDDILWKALERVELKDAISEMPEGLNGNVSENGSNFSIGQRQLICLARAIVRNNKILIMDEATANVDPYTDNLIQKTIRETFANCTVITIAHRLHTIMDSNRVLVIDAGTLVEFDHPYKLLQNQNSIFSSMVNTAGRGVAKNLHSIAKENFANAKRS